MKALVQDPAAHSFGAPPRAGHDHGGMWQSKTTYILSQRAKKEDTPRLTTPFEDLLPRPKDLP